MQSDEVSPFRARPDCGHGGPDTNIWRSQSDMFHHHSVHNRPRRRPPVNPRVPILGANPQRAAQRAP